MSGAPEYEHTIISNGGENPDSWDHPKINNSFDPLVIKDAIEQAEKYWDMRNVWDAGVETFIRSIQASLSQAWSGLAAEQSKQAIQDYIDNHARPVTPALEMLSSGIQKAATAISDTKNSLPETIHVDGRVERWWNQWQNEDEINRRTEEARVAMASRYVGPFGQLDTEVPVIPVPAGPTTTTDIPKPPPGGYPAGTDTGNPSTTTSGSPDGGAPGGTPGGEDPGVPGEETQSGAPGEDPAGLPTGPGETAPTAPAGTESPSAPTAPANTAPAGVNTGPGAPGGAPPGGAQPGTPGAPGGPGSPEAPGRSVPGAPSAPGGPQGAPAAGPAAANAAGSRGMAGGGMPMGGAGRGGNQENENNRATPDYLITQENTDELLGDAPPIIPGGVIGETPT